MAVIVHTLVVVLGRATPLRCVTSAAGRGIGDRSGGHSEFGENHELEGQIASEDQQHDQKIVQEDSLQIDTRFVTRKTLQVQR